MLVTEAGHWSWTTTTTLVLGPLWYYSQNDSHSPSPFFVNLNIFPANLMSILERMGAAGTSDSP